MRLPEQQLQDFICLSGLTQVYPTGTSSQVVLQNLRYPSRWDRVVPLPDHQGPEKARF